MNVRKSRKPPDTSEASAIPEWTFLVFVVGFFVLIGLRSLVG
jgi:hypothetical protein